MILLAERRSREYGEQGLRGSNNTPHARKTAPSNRLQDASTSPRAHVWHHPPTRKGPVKLQPSQRFAVFAGYLIFVIAITSDCELRCVAAKLQ